MNMEFGYGMICTPLRISGQNLLTSGSWLSLLQMVYSHTAVVRSWLGNKCLPDNQYGKEDERNLQRLYLSCLAVR